MRYLVLKRASCYGAHFAAFENNEVGVRMSQPVGTDVHARLFDKGFVFSEAILVKC